MYLTKFECDRFAEKSIDADKMYINRHALIKKICSAYGGASREDLGITYYLAVHDDKYTLYIQSDGEPEGDIHPFDKKDSICIDEVLDGFQDGDSVTVASFLSVYYSLKGKKKYYQSAGQRYEKIRKKGEQYGFTATMIRELPETKNVVYFENKNKAHPYRGSETGYEYLIDMTIKDKAKFREFFRSGFLAGKAWGFGMVRLA